MSSEQQRGVGEAMSCVEQSSSGSEAVSLAGEQMDVQRPLLHTEQDSLLRGCLLRAWQGLRDVVRTCLDFFLRQWAMRSLTEPESPAEKLNDDCLAAVLNRTDTHTRLVLQSVSTQWLRVGRAFRHLKAFEFRVQGTSKCVSRNEEVPALSGAKEKSLESSSDEEEEESLESSSDEMAFVKKGFLQSPFHWKAFLRALTLSKGSVREINLNLLSEVELNLIMPHINEKLCPGVRHLKMDLYKEDSVWTQPVNILCDPTRLPKLDAVTLRCYVDLHKTSLAPFVARCLPNLKSLGLQVQKEVSENTQEALRSVLSSLPSSLHSLVFMGAFNFSLQPFLLRLQCNPGLPKLTSLLLVREVGAEQSGGPRHQMLASVCQALAHQLTEFELMYDSTLRTDYLAPLGLLTSLRCLQLRSFNTPVGPADVATVLRALRRLQRLQLFLGNLAGGCDALVDSLGALTELHELFISWRCVRDHLDRLGAALPQLQRLWMETNYGDSAMSQEQRAGLLSLVGRCTRLEHLCLDVIRSWGLDRTSELLREMESVLIASRAAPPCPHSSPLQGVKSPGPTPLSAAPPCPPTSQEVSRGCDKCPRPTPLCVRLPHGFNADRKELKRIFETSPFIRLS